MPGREIRKGVSSVGAIDWNRRLFDSLIPLPDGTSYNAYLVQGSEKTALIDTVDPTKVDILLENLASVPRIDYLIAHHAEQDHSGAIPDVLAKYPAAKLVVTPKGKELVMSHLRVAEGRIITVGHRETLSLGDKTLEFLHTPWVHWPETMCTYLREERILFSCDFFGSHLAASGIFVADEAQVAEAAKRYYAEIMMPFRPAIRKNMEVVHALAIDLIAPSHGPIYQNPAFILDRYDDWISELPKNEVVIPYVTMHGSTGLLVGRLVEALSRKGIAVLPFDLAAADIGKLAIALVDAATVVVGTPTVHAGPHPVVVFAANLLNCLRPKLKFASVVGSFGWAGQAVERIGALISNLKVELLPPVVCKGLPTEKDLEAIDGLADAIAQKHRAAGLVSA